MKNCSLILFFLAFMSPVAGAAVSTESGDLQSFLNAITFGAQDDGQFKIPTPAQLAEFSNVVHLVLQADYEKANARAHDLDYELVAYTDTVSGNLYYVLRETNLIPSPLANGGGTYIFRPDATYNVAIHAPHPGADTDTNEEGISLFLASDTRYFMMAGAHRRSHPDPSTCQNFSDYRPSDAVHNKEHYFYVAHKAMEDFDPTIHYVELHGYSGASFDIVISQCATGGNPAVANMSETLADETADEYTLMHVLEDVLQDSGEIVPCIYSPILDTGPDDKYTQYLGGGTNTLARYTNGSASVCDEGAIVENNTHRYLHLEQSWDIRTNTVTRELMIGYISEAIRSYFEDRPFEINAGLNDHWYYPVTDGQGVYITVFPDLGKVNLTWFTYDTELPPQDAVANLGDPGHRWFNALGPYSGNQAAMTIKVASGGIFDTETEVTRVVDGTIILTFDSCESGTIEYDIPSMDRVASSRSSVSSVTILRCARHSATSESTKQTCQV